MRKKCFILISCLCLIVIVLNLFCQNSIIAMADTEFNNLTAKSYIVVDDSGNILIEKDSNKKREVASICKLMTVLLTLEKIECNDLSLNDKFVASSKACDAEGSQAFLDAGSEYLVSDLLKSVIVASANDSAIVLAEGIAGNEDLFVVMMNARAKELGMNNTVYANSTGLPAMEQYSTAKDTALLLNEVSKYKIYQDDCKIWMDKLIHPSGRKTELVNTNRLIKYYNYCKTGKTGFTDEAGYCLSSTSEKDNLKLTCVVLGTNSSASRFTESMELLNYCFANFKSELIVSKDEIINNEISIIGGKNNSIEISPEKDFYLTINKQKDLDYEIKFDLPKIINAPIEENDVVGSMIIISDGEVVTEINLVSKSNIEKQNYFDIINKIIDNFPLI